MSSAPLAVPDATGARQSSLREANLALVVRTVLAAPAPPTRAGVAAATRMTRATASRLVDELIAGGVLDELDRPEASGRGRPARPLSGGRRLAALGLEVNVTHLAGRAVSLGGHVLAERVEPGDFHDSDPAATLARLDALAAGLLARLPGGTRVVGAGLALPGITDAASGTLLLAPNLGWSELRPADHLPLAARQGPPLRIGNEADLAARAAAETAPGRPGPLPDFLYLSGDSGLGGAAVLDGAVLGGRHGRAGEIGHVCVDPDGPPCRCGSTGCLERYAGLDALLAAAGLGPDRTVADLAAAVRAGDPAARRAVDRAAGALGVALAGAINILDIPTVLLGGHLAEIADLLIPPLRQRLDRRVLSARWTAPTVQAHTGPPAPAATGAALLRLAEVVDRPVHWLGA
ncbi:ROK family protein [Actinomadura parmotrematis]|uniref:ROK family protein n=1 Tax=Actinomadura parmotrematis TaxID=2864039 RepID=A0ABS7G1Z7_9ACTN|nr:ROK family protein [Actinomadura parmotrematis]MBW8486740.1 ROK family protein [Actinomadura parmotrematis]